MVSAEMKPVSKHTCLSLVKTFKGDVSTHRQDALWVKKVTSKCHVPSKDTDWLWLFNTPLLKLVYFWRLFAMLLRLLEVGDGGL